MSTDTILKEVLLRAPLERVWRAIGDSQRFGEWFGVAFDGPFVVGRRLSGRIVPTRVDPEVARLQEPHAGKPFDIWVERLEPMHCFAFRWHPYAVDPAVDVAKEPTTLVTFELSPAPGGTRLRITETGFDQLPPSRRDEAFRANDGGWSHQCVLVGKYLALPAGDGE